MASQVRLAVEQTFGYSVKPRLTISPPSTEATYQAYGVSHKPSRTAVVMGRDGLIVLIPQTAISTEARADAFKKEARVFS